MLAVNDELELELGSAAWLLDNSLDELAGALDKLAGALEELTGSLEGTELLRLLSELSLETSELDGSALDGTELEAPELDICELDACTLDAGASELLADELRSLALDNSAWLDSLLALYGADETAFDEELPSLDAREEDRAGVDENGVDEVGADELGTEDAEDETITTTGGLDELALLTTSLLVSLLADDENTEENTDEASDEFSGVDDTVPGTELLSATLAGDDWLVGVETALTGCALLDAAGAPLPPPPPQA